MTKQHPLTDEDCKQIMLAVSNSWDHDKDPTLLIYELMRSAYDLATKHFFEWTIVDESIRIDSQGFHYREQCIEDSGEAHRLLVEFLRKQQKEI